MLLTLSAPGRMCTWQHAISLLIIMAFLVASAFMSFTFDPFWLPFGTVTLWAAIYVCEQKPLLKYGQNLRDSYAFCDDIIGAIRTSLIGIAFWFLGICCRSLRESKDFWDLLANQLIIACLFHIGGSSVRTMKRSPHTIHLLICAPARCPLAAIAGAVSLSTFILIASSLYEPTLKSLLNNQVLQAIRKGAAVSLVDQVTAIKCWAGLTGLWLGPLVTSMVKAMCAEGFDGDMLMALLEELKPNLAWGPDGDIEFGMPFPYEDASPDALTVRLPSEVFQDHSVQPQGSVVLECQRLIAARSNNSETLLTLLQDYSRFLNIEAYEGERSYARVRVSLQHENIVRSIIKGIAKERGKKRVTVRRIQGTLTFDSPRD